MMTKEGSTKIVNVMSLWAWPYVSYSENAFFLLKFSFLLPGIDQTKYKIMMTKEGSTKIVNIYKLIVGTAPSLITRCELLVLISFFVIFWRHI